MLQMRARGFALRDAFPDALQGLILAEEAHDHPREVETIGESKTYTSTTEKLIANLGSAKHMPIPEDAIIQSDPTNGVIVEAEIMPEVSLAEQLTILIDDKAVPIEVIQKWLSKSGVAKLSDMSDEDLTKCIAFVHEKY
jgi:TusA-related sulfurtransferase